MIKFEDNYPLKNVTTLQIGGPAKKFVRVTTDEQFIEAIKYAKDENLPYLIIGGGSNLLVSDQGVACLVIKNKITGISHPRGVTLKVKSGTILQDLVNYSIKNGLAGLEKLAGIPGTVGGAVFGNAGAYGQTISDCLTEVIVFDGEKNITFSKDKCNFSYRNSEFKKNKYSILEATFQLEAGDPKTLSEESNDVLTKRAVKYPPGIKCPGSFFKNLIASEIPAEIIKEIAAEKIVYGKIPAGTLLEEVGAKGQRVDGIHIAPYHANLFINNGSGNAKAFYDLAKTYALKVKEKFGITLEPEVQLINLPPL